MSIGVLSCFNTPSISVPAPGATSIVLTALQTPSVPEAGPRGIAIIDIPTFL